LYLVAPFVFAHCRLMLEEVVAEAFNPDGAGGSVVIDRMLLKALFALPEIARTLYL
jgi:hypothetical protein